MSLRRSRPAPPPLCGALAALCAAAALLAALLAAGEARAQIRTDGSLGVGGPVTISKSPRGRGTLDIGSDLGVRRKANLFHSFSTFNVGRNQLARFEAPKGVGRVIARVTGDAPSRLKGSVAVTENLKSDVPKTADFWLVNPNGLALGPGARFFIGEGALNLSAGDSVVFRNGERFSVTEGGSTLSVEAPEAFGFIGRAPGKLTLDGTRLIQRGGVALAAGEIAARDATLEAPRKAPMTLIGARKGDARRADGGDIASSAPAGAIRLDGSTVLSQAGGDVRISAGVVALGAGSQILTLLPDGSTDVAGALELHATDLTIGEGGQLASQVPASARAGDVTVIADGFIDIEGGRRDSGNAPTGIFSIVSATGGVDGKGRSAGDVTVRGGSIRLANNARIFANSVGYGDAGDVSVRADTIQLENGGQIGGGIPENDGQRIASGRGGTVEVTARLRFEASGLGQKNIVAAGEDPPGGRTSLAEKLKNKEDFEPSGVFTSTENTSGDAKRAGDVTVRAPRIVLSDGAEIASESLNDARGGFVRVEAGELLSLSNQAEITAQSNTADSGDVEVEGSGSVFLRDGSLIATKVRGENAPGDAGDIFVSGGFLLLDASKILAEGVEGQGGDIDIKSFALAISPDSVISALSERNVSGDIGIDSPIGQITDAVAALENPLPDTSGALRLTCSQRAAEGSGGAFVIETAAPVPVDPWNYLPALYAPEAAGGLVWILRESPCPDVARPRRAIR